MFVIWESDSLFSSRESSFKLSGSGSPKKALMRLGASDSLFWEFLV